MNVCRVLLISTAFGRRTVTFYVHCATVDAGKEGDRGRDRDMPEKFRACGLERPRTVDGSSNWLWTCGCETKTSTFSFAAMLSFSLSLFYFLRPKI